MMALGFKCIPLDGPTITALSPGRKLVQAVTCTGSVVCNSGSTISFGKLKAQRLKFYGGKVGWMKQHHYASDNLAVENAPLKDQSGSLPKPEFPEEQKRLDVVGSRESQRRETNSRKARNQNGRTRGDMGHSVVAVKPGIKQPLKSQHTPTKSKEYNNQDVSVPKVPIASLKGWGKGGFIHNVLFEYTDNAMQRGTSPSESAFFSRKSFRELGCNDTMVESLRGQLILRPSCIQALAFASVLEGKCCIIADQSGSGKTLAYLIPVIQRLRQEELQGLSKSLPQCPRVIILVPTAELACQVLRNCRSISRFGVPFRSMVATGGFRQKTQQESIQQNLDVLIATPGRFFFLIKEGLLQLTNLRCAVLDEVDLLFNNEEYEPALQSLVNSSAVATQYIFVTATLPRDIYNKLVEVFPDSELIMGPGMHRTSPELEEILVDCSGDSEAEKTPDTAFANKKSALLRLVDKIPVPKTIIFCNKIETCRKVENVLNRLDRKETCKRVLPFHAALAQESRLANMEKFCNSQSKDKSLFLVSTDRASRGIDFTGVDHVVLFDYPRDPSEYVRRVGRTARGAGGKGKAFIFVVGKQVSLARRIIERNGKGHPLHDLPSTVYG